MRGEKLSAIVKWICTMGSPPHARGKEGWCAIWRTWIRITPACAGKSSPPHDVSRKARDHPRMRGEKYRGDFHANPIPGSPPHARGKECWENGKQDRTRITPACAGKRVPCVFQILWGQDHPRMRGEKALSFVTVMLSTGSPPHARGKVLLFLRSIGLDGITPACAGKSRDCCCMSGFGWDHPRMRGEKIPENRDRWVSWGITPACAGKSHAGGRQSTPERDHPRMRGEKTKKIPI